MNVRVRAVVAFDQSANHSESNQPRGRIPLSIIIDHPPIPIKPALSHLHHFLDALHSVLFVQLKLNFILLTIDT